MTNLELSSLPDRVAATVERGEPGPWCWAVDEVLLWPPDDGFDDSLGHFPQVVPPAVFARLDGEVFTIVKPCPQCGKRTHSMHSNLRCANVGCASGTGEVGGSVSVARATLRVLPVTLKDIHGEPPDRYVYVLADGRSFLCQGDHEEQLDINPPPSPGQYVVILEVVD